MTTASTPTTAARPSRGRGKLLLVLAVCAAPVIASYITYYFVKPTARTNHGTLVEPQRPLPALQLAELDGKPVDVATLKGKWLMISADGGACGTPCEDKLVQMRQVRLTAGKDRDRVERIWLVTDREPLQTMLMRQHEGLRLLRADPKQVSAWLPVESATTIADHIYLVDPLGNLMMRFPKNADPNATKKDLLRLLRASRIG